MFLSSIHKHNPYRVWLTFSGLSAMGFTLVFTVNMVYQAEHVGLNPLQLVLVGTVLEIACFCFEIPTGIVADVYSRRLSVILGSLLIGIGFIVEGLLPFFGGILLAQVLWGIGATFHSGAADAWLADEIGEEDIAQAYLRSTQIGQIASFGAIIGSIGLAALNIQLAIVMGGIFHLLTALYLLLFMPEEGFTRTPKAERETFGAMARTFREGVRTIRLRPVLLTIVAITFIYGAYSESYDRLFTAHFLTNFTFPAVAGRALPSVMWFGLIGMVSLLFGATFTELIRRRVKTDTPNNLIRALMGVNLALIAAVLVFALTGNLLLAVAANLLVGALRSVSHPLTSAWLNQGLDPKVRATVLSMVSQTNAVGQIAGGPVLGWMGVQFGLRAALAVGGCLLAPATLLYNRTLQKQHEDSSRSEPVIIEQV